MKLGPETIAQIQVYEWVKNNSTLPFVYIVNEGRRGFQEIEIMKRMGFCPGASDIFIPRATKEYYGAFIELKCGKNKLSDNQKKFLDSMAVEGYFAGCVWESKAAIDLIKHIYNL